MRLRLSYSQPHRGCGCQKNMRLYAVAIAVIRSITRFWHYCPQWLVIFLSFKLRYSGSAELNATRDRNSHEGLQLRLIITTPSLLSSIVGSIKVAIFVFSIIYFHQVLSKWPYFPVCRMNLIYVVIISILSIHISFWNF